MSLVRIAAHLVEAGGHSELVGVETDPLAAINLGVVCLADREGVVQTESVPPRGALNVGAAVGGVCRDLPTGKKGLVWRRRFTEFGHKGNAQ
jgi:hypothetical protein